MLFSFPEIPIVYEDEDVLAINKPAGLVVNRSQTQKEPTVQDWIEQTRSPVVRQPVIDSPMVSQDFAFGSPEEMFKERSGIVHRLDKETSGVLLIAKHPDALVWYMSQFKQRLTQKTYVGLVHGKVQPQQGTIDLPIARNSSMRLQFAVREDGRESQTQYRVLSFYPKLNVEKIEAAAFHEHAQQGLSKNFRRASKIYQGFSLVEMKPKTGRTHQLRVHFSHIHHPLVGDKVYSGSKRRLVDQIWCARHFLHAQSLKIAQYRTKNELNIEAPLAEDLKKVLTYLEEYASL